MDKVSFQTCHNGRKHLAFEALGVIVNKLSLEAPVDLLRHPKQTKKIAPVQVVDLWTVGPSQCETYTVPKKIQESRTL